ncbi:MAG: TldD/PmbA family protein [Chloroflexi bacterium]|nr:TldD/PmbA family protein [Chloroflexota bacterium]
MAALDVAVAALERARRLGAAQAEAFANDFRTSTIEVREGEVETLVSAESRGVALRVLHEGGMGYAHTTDLSSGGLAEVAERALRLAREATPDPARVLAEPRMPPPEPLDIFDPRLAEVSPERKIELLREAERRSRAADARVRATDLARYVDGMGTVALANSRGVSVAFEQSTAYAVLVLVAGQDGEQQLGHAYTLGHGFDALSSERLGREAARRAAASLGGKPLPTGRATVVMEPEVAAELLSSVAQALSGEAVLKGRSMFLGQQGARVASAEVTLVDQGDLRGGLATRPVDGEGVPTQRTVLLEQGVLRGYLHNLYSARKLGVSSTGNARRDSFRHTPEIGPSNLALEPGALGPEQLIAQVERGFYVITTRNVGGINPISGDYSVGAAGLAIEQGALAGPVAQVTIAANIREMLQHLSARANDLRWIPSAGAIGSPTLRIDEMMVAGG